jgi:hypothetical protein
VNELQDYLKPRTIEVSTESVNTIHRVLEAKPEDGVFVFEHQLMCSILQQANVMLNDDSFKKEPLAIDNTMLIYRYNNCTDAAATQLALCEAVGIPAAGKFSSTLHASTIIPGDNTHWNMAGESTHDLKHSSCITPFISPEKIEATNQGLKNLETCDGVYVFKPAHTISWDSREIHGDNIRANSPVFDSLAGKWDIDDAFVLVNTPLAYTMFHAIDVLDTLRSNQQNSLVVSAYLSAKQRLKHLVPRMLK